MSKACVEGNLNRVACAMIGTLASTNTVLECLDLSQTGIGVAIGNEAEGGHILFKPLCESRDSQVSQIALQNVQLSDKAGGKLINALTSGLGAGDLGYEKIKTLSLAKNDLGKQFAAALKQLMWSERAQCMLQKLNVSDNVALDGFDLAVALKRNDSLTSLDVRGVPGANADDIYAVIGSHLLLDACTCRLGSFACARGVAALLGAAARGEVGALAALSREVGVGARAAAVRLLGRHRGVRARAALLLRLLRLPVPALGRERVRAAQRRAARLQRHAARARCAERGARHRPGRLPRSSAGSCDELERRQKRKR